MSEGRDVAELVQQALVTVRRILDTTREPTFPGEVPHHYDDKYALAEVLVKLHGAAYVKCLEKLGLTADGLRALKQHAEQHQSVTLRLNAEERFIFVRKATREEESPATQYVSGIVTYKTVTTITEWFWTYELRFQVLAFPGAAPNERSVVLQERSGTSVARCELITRSETPPFPEVTVRPPVDVDITWLLNCVASSADARVAFAIDRAHPKCFTPRRNPDIDKALDFNAAMRTWMNAVRSYFTSGALGQVQSTHTGHGSQVQLGSIRANNVFVPVVPLFEGEATRGDRARAVVTRSLVGMSALRPSAVTLSLDDVNAFLAEQSRSLDERMDEVAREFAPHTVSFLGLPEAAIIVICDHAAAIHRNTLTGLNYIEEMLRAQLVAAIGKIVTPLDLAQYMRYHNRRLFREEFVPNQFCYAIRRPDHYPEGIVSIESAGDTDNAMDAPVPTVVRHVPARRAAPMRFPLDASTQVTFFGDRFLHSMVLHRFSTEAPSPLTLVARARQFSSFILLVGTIASAEVFEPKAALIVKNKDELRLPLVLEQIPAPKAFRDAISALSPEQQRFARAYRSMQLSATLFGVCIIQIKPQLERLLNLPEDAMTKEIRLTEDLLDLFIRYQIPSDQLKYDGAAGVPPQDKIAFVKSRVSEMQQMIQASKEEELAQAAQEHLFNHLEGEIEPECYFESECCDDEECEAEDCSSSAQSFPKDLRLSSPRASPTPDVARRSTAAPPPRPQPQQPQQQQQKQQQPEQPQDRQQQQQQQQQEQTQGQEQTEGEVSKLDVSKLPTALEAGFDRFDEEGALRPTIIKLGDAWHRKRFAALLQTTPTAEALCADEQQTERNTAYDLLDALSRSGSLAVHDATLHVVVAGTHCFDKTLMDTVIQNNVNPIEKLERSVLISASAIHGLPAPELVRPEQLLRVSTYSPALFAADAAPLAIE